MKVTVRVSKSFKRLAKPLIKKYNSLSNELVQLQKDLENNPKLGTPIGSDSYKIRLAVKSKGKGKSGGLRVISHLSSEIIGIFNNDGDEISVTLVSIYDKSETASISDKELKELISGIEHE